MKRKIITINEQLCTGCGNCIPDCPEGALKIIDGKARLVSDLFCDGLGACIGSCPTGAMSVEEKEAEAYDEKRVMKEQIIPKGENTIKEHLIHLNEHGETTFLSQAIASLNEAGITVPSFDKDTHCHGPGCPGSQNFSIEKETEQSGEDESKQVPSRLEQWPVQLHLINPGSPFFENAELLISADCVPYAYGNFHNDFLKGKKVITFCPKLDNSHERYIDKLTEILKSHTIKSITVLRMEVPCCGGTTAIVQEAISRSGAKVPFLEETIKINGEIR